MNASWYMIDRPTSTTMVVWSVKGSGAHGKSVIDADESYLMADSSTWPWPDVNAFRIFLTDLQRIVEEDSRFGVIGWLPRGRSGATESADTPFDP